MTKIDHRILIPTTPNIVWDFISDITNNPNWQVDCREISFLNASRKGPGTRWRYTNERGRAFVVEIMTWYDRLGYEYTIVDGGPYKSNKGRIRLQETVEGTVVEWSFSYELKGPFSGMRNALGTQRAIENVIVDSLWTLWRLVSQEKHVVQETKALMQDAPDVEARAHYKPRHPSVMQQQEHGDSREMIATAPLPVPVDAEPVPAMPAPPEIHPEPAPEPTYEYASPPHDSPIQEPPVADDDTRPRVAVQPEAAPLYEPDFLSGVKDDMIPNAPVQTPVVDHIPQPDEQPVETPQPAAEQDSPIVVSATVDELVADDKDVPFPSVPLAQPQAVPEPQIAASPHEPQRYDLHKQDTAKISVFELFGLPKPSETQEVLAIMGGGPASSGGVITGKRTGRRYVLRSRQINLRRPK